MTRAITNNVAKVVTFSLLFGILTSGVTGCVGYEREEVEEGEAEGTVGGEEGEGEGEAEDQALNLLTVMIANDRLNKKKEGHSNAI